MANNTLEPTEEQLDYVNDICNTLNVEEPEDFTRESYSYFISQYKDKVYNNRYGSDFRYPYWE